MDNKLFNARSMTFFTIMREAATQLGLHAICATVGDVDGDEEGLYTMVMSTMSPEASRKIFDHIYDQVHEDEPRIEHDVQA